MLMIDTETLATTPDAVILSIGVVRFNWQEILSKQLILVDPNSQPDRKIDPETVKWWLNQSKEAQLSAFFDNPYDNKRCSLTVALRRLSCIYECNCNSSENYEKVWSHGATFDISLLENAYRSLDMHIPWRYKDVRDTRTLYDFHPNYTSKISGTQHNALDDAVYQTERLIESYNHIMGLNNE